MKLLVKEIIIPRQSNNLLFVIGPFITLVFAFFGWAIIPFGEGLSIFDYELGVFFALAVSSIGSYGILVSGWAANSKYSFMGAIRSTAQLLSYELVFSSIVLVLIIFSGSFSLTYIVECQQAVWNIFPLLPIGLMFFIAILAETNRAPFDLPEAESELVAGFMTEHSASVFVFFFLGEYASLILMSTFMTIFFLGGHHSPDLHKIIIEGLMLAYDFIKIAIFDTYKHLESFFNYFWNHNDSWYIVKKDLTMDITEYISTEKHFTEFSSKDIILDGISRLIDYTQGSYILGFKIIIVVFLFIWVRASFPRFRYDQLMSLCWKELLPLVFAYLLFTICLFYSFDMMPYGTSF
jgi:NADH-ubiquinone oxidoreductase chain 1